MNLGLYWEHNWTGDSPIITREARTEWARRLAGQIEGYVDSLEADSAHALGAMIRKEGSNARFYVFNSLSWVRTDVADLPWDGPSEVQVIDLESGTEVPSQIVMLDWKTYKKGCKYLRILARDIPPVGYRVFEVRSASPGTWAESPVAMDGVIQNSRYRLSVAGSGAITSLVDKTRGGREFVRSIEGRTINDIGGAEGELAVENAGAVSVTLRADVEKPLARTTRITLYRDLQRIDIANEINQNFSDVLSWIFAFNLDSPDVRHEEVGAILRARLATDGGHYSPVHSRLDWLTLNHFADMSGADGVGVTLSNADLAFMKLGKSEVVDGVSRLDTSTPQLSVLAGGQVDGPKLGIPAQGGDSTFLQRFALRTHSRFTSTEAMEFALEHQNPLKVGVVTGGDRYPEKSFSLLRLDGDDVVLWALKPAEEGIGDGLIARVWNLASERREFSLSLAAGIDGARRVTHIETDLEDSVVKSGKLSGSLAPMQVSTYRLTVPTG